MREASIDRRHWTGSAPNWGCRCWLALALVPVGAGVAVANLIAGQLDPLVRAVLAPAVDAAAGLPDLPAAVLAGDFGLLTMGPLLLVWALPTVLVLAARQGLATASGLSDRVSVALDPLTRRVGLQGRDLIRVLIGFGCNVPAVVGTRSCSSCTRDTTIAAIAWGAACSYQLPASVAVFAAASRWWLVWPYLLLLAATTMGYAWLVSRRQRAGVQLLPLMTRRSVLSRPRFGDVRRETAVVTGEFLRKALPIFLTMSAIAALIDHTGGLDRIATAVEGAMGVVGLPAATATPVVLAAICKDGILLLEQTAPLLSAGQLLTAVFLAGTLLPCLVTADAIARERGVRTVTRLVGRHAAVAATVAIALGLLLPS